MSSSKDNNCRVWDLATMECVACYSGHTDSVGAVAVSQVIFFHMKYIILLIFTSKINSMLS